MIRSLRDSRGLLSWTEGLSSQGKPWVRAYWMTGAVPGAVRGEHAHRRTTRYIILLQGAVRLTVEERPGVGYSRVLEEGEGQEVGAGSWTRLDAFSPGAVVLVLADREYSEGDVVGDREEWARGL